MSRSGPERIERAAWAWGAGLLGASLLLRSTAVTAGVAVGVLVAVVNFRLLVRFVEGLVAPGGRRAPRARLALHFLKYGLSAAVIAAAFKFRVADPIAVLAGASVLLPALLREALAPRADLSQKEA